MSEKNLPIKLVLQKATDTQPNKGRGDVKFFGDVTPALQEEMAEEFNNVLAYYEDVFQECDMIPAVGKITVRPEAIAKSHKPNDLCRCCHIIGSEDLNEIYIKVTKKTILDTIEFIKNPPSQRFRANMTAVLNVQPIFPQDKVTNELSEMSQQGKFDSIKTRIKIKVFDFNDEFDNSQIFEYVMRKLAALGLSENHEIITYGNQIKYIKVQVESFEDIKKIAEINGVKNVDFFQEYSLPTCEYTRENLKVLVDTVSDASDVSIGIIDGGISDDNPFLKPYIIDRKCYVGDAYRNPSHATFIASTILYGNMLNEIPASTSRKFRFVDIVAIPNGDSRFGPTDTISEEELMEIIVDAMEEYSASTKIWNLSLGIENKVCNGAMSDLGIFLDYVQDKYKVQIFVSSGNLNQPPFREWPPQGNMGDRDRISGSADSLRAFTVGAIAFDKVQARMKANKKAPARSKSDEDFILTGKLVCGNCGALMVGDSGTSHTGATYYYYKCGHRKRKEGERCHMKAFRKELIESFVVKRALGYVLQDSVIAMLADALVENQKRENTHLPALQEELNRVNKKIDNIAAAIEEGIITQTTKERLTALEAQRDELQISIFEEETSHPKLTKEYVVQWLESFKQRDLRDPKVRRQVIECFVNTVYVFEDKIIVNLNLRDGDKPIALSKETGSDIETFGSPRSTTSFEVVLFSLYVLFNRCRA